MNQSQDTQDALAQELCLVDRVTEILARKGHPHPDAWKHYPYPLHEHATQSPDHMVQRFLINRQWQLVIKLAHTIPTNVKMDAVYCLVDQGSDEEWLESFEYGVSPCVIEHSLPNLTT